MINVLIPAAGKGTRSNLKYPKTLYKIKGTPIIISLIKTIISCKIKLNKIIIISNPKGKIQISYQLKKYGLKKYCDIVIQDRPNGMGDAILNFEKSKFFFDTNKILLIWGDIPYPSVTTLENLIKYNKIKKDVLSFPTRYVSNPYTYVNIKNFTPTSIIETKNKKYKRKKGFRDVGIFVFDRSIIFKFLKKKYKAKIDNFSHEHGFLYIVNILYKKNFKIGAYNIATKKDLISFNQFEDLKEL